MRPTKSLRLGVVRDVGVGSGVSARVGEGTGPIEGLTTIVGVADGCPGEIAPDGDLIEGPQPARIARAMTSRTRPFIRGSSSVDGPREDEMRPPSSGPRLAGPKGLARCAIGGDARRQETTAIATSAQTRQSRPPGGSADCKQWLRSTPPCTPRVDGLRGFSGGAT